MAQLPNSRLVKGQYKQTQMDPDVGTVPCTFQVLYTNLPILKLKNTQDFHAAVSDYFFFEITKDFEKMVVWLRAFFSKETWDHMSDISLSDLRSSPPNFHFHNSWWTQFLCLCLCLMVIFQKHSVFLKCVKHFLAPVFIKPYTPWNEHHYISETRSQFWPQKRIWIKHLTSNKIPKTFSFLGVKPWSLSPLKGFPPRPPTVHPVHPAPDGSPSDRLLSETQGWFNCWGRCPGEVVGWEVVGKF